MMVNVLALLALLYFGREIFIPIAIAFVIATVLRPVVQRLERWRIPAPAGAATVVLTGLLILWAIGFALTPAVQGFVTRLPDVAVAAGAKLHTLPRPLDRLGTMISSAAAELRAPATPPDSLHARSDSAPGHRAETHAPSAGGSSLSGAVPVIGRIFGTAAGMVSGFVATMLLVLFFLAAGDGVHRRLTKRAATSPLARAVVDITDELHSIIARYLSLLSLINLGQGTVIAIAMSLVGMPAPVVWGAMAFVAEFFPYLGSATMVILLILVGLADSSGVGHVLIAPLIYMGVTTVQNSVVSPLTYGKYLKLSPPAILVSVMVWWLIWGVLGAFLAVPILALVRIACDHQKGPLGALGALIEG